MKRLLLLILPLFFAGCMETTPPAEPRILVMGDSLMAAHRISGRAISDSVSKALNEPVVDRSLVGARMIYHLPLSGAVGFNIASQYRGGTYDWVIANGGGNDLWLVCGCTGCTRKLDQLITKDLKSGRIPELVTKLEGSGGRILWVGYLRSPGFDTPIESCGEEGDELESRIQKLAAERTSLHYLSLADLVPEGDRSYHGFDLIHPSLKASAEIGGLIAEYIRGVDSTR
jgi:hypothetical protein